jgi:hypothetical protein
MPFVGAYLTLWVEILPYGRAIHGCTALGVQLMGLITHLVGARLASPHRRVSHIHIPYVMGVYPVSYGCTLQALYVRFCDF